MLGNAASKIALVLSTLAILLAGMALLKVSAEPAPVGVDGCYCQPERVSGEPPPMSYFPAQGGSP